MKRRLKIGDRVKIIESNRRRLNHYWVGKVGTIKSYSHKFGKFEVDLATSLKLYYYPEELQPIKQVKLKQFSAWK